MGCDARSRRDIPRLSVLDRTRAWRATRINVIFAGEGGKLDLSGAYLARGAEHIDTTLVVDHAVPRCESRELFKGVLDGQARGVFQGKIIVRPDAQKTDGKQMSQALMLSEDAEFDSKPELEIFADDVVCGHGTTSAELDRRSSVLLPLARNSRERGAGLMIESFIGEALDKVEHEELRTALDCIRDEWLGRSAARIGQMGSETQDLLSLEARPRRRG